MITLTVNGKKVRAKEETTLLEVCQKMSIPIPTLCHHPDLTPHGSCRLCTVEVSDDGRTRMVTACNYPVRQGITVETHSERVLQARRVLVELLMARCPQVAIVQDLARKLGVQESPFKTENPQNDCLLCGLCVRTCNEIVGANAIGFSRRGTRKRIGTPFEIDSERCVACGACESVCPTRAVRMEMDRIRTIKKSGTGTQRHCRYMRLGLVDYMICSNGFECWRCEFDQTMEDRFGRHPAFAVKPGRTKEPVQVNGFTYFPDYLYDQGHLWVKSMDPYLRIGLDDPVSRLAVEADSIKFPPVGSTLKKNGVLAEIVAAGKKANLLSPVTGTVTAVNRDVEESPNLPWRDPYRRGWLLMIKPARPEEVSQLYSGESAKIWFEEATTKLAALFTGKQNLSKKEESGKNPSIQRLVREHWNDMVKILLKNKEKKEER